MKKIMVAFALLLTVGMVQGCTPKTDTSKEAQTSEKQNDTFNFVLEIDGEEKENKEVTFEQGDTLLEVMTREFDVVEDNGMITAIEGYKNDDKASKYLTYYVNGEMPEVGASDYVLQPNDKIEWKLEEINF